MTAVGDTLHVFDRSYRVYERNEVLYRAHFRPVLVVEETRVSWIVRRADHRGRRTVRKRDMTVLYPNDESPRLKVYTQAQRDDKVWRYENQGRLVAALQDHRTSIRKLREIAALLDHA